MTMTAERGVEFGTGESSSEAELGGFLIDRETKRNQWEEGLDAVTRMFAEEPFAGVPDGLADPILIIRRGADRGRFTQVAEA